MNLHLVPSAGDVDQAATKKQQEQQSAQEQGEQLC
jgi:hypothetical protein